MVLAVVLSATSAFLWTWVVVRSVRYNELRLTRLARVGMRPCFKAADEANKTAERGVPKGCIQHTTRITNSFAAYARRVLEKWLFPSGRKAANVDRELEMVAIQLLNELRTGRSLFQCILNIASRSTGCLTVEFRKVLDQYQAGISLGQALRLMKKRIPSRDLNYFLSVLELYMMIGGDMTPSMNAIVNVIRERRLFHEELRAKLSDVAFSARLVSLMPLAMSIFLWRFRPDLMGPLLFTATGRWYLAYAIISWGIGIRLIHKFSSNLAL